MIVAFRKHTLLPLDDCLYALQATIPHLTRSSLHRCLQRHGISRLPEVEANKPKQPFKTYPIGYFHIDIAEVSTDEGQAHLFVAIDRTCKFAFANCIKTATSHRCRLSGSLVDASPTRSTPCLLTTASSSAMPSSIAQGRQRATGSTYLDRRRR